MIGAFVSQARAAMANGMPAPMEPATPLTIRRGGGDQALRPLRELTAIAEKHGFGIALDDRLQCGEHFSGVQSTILAFQRRPVLGAAIEQTPRLTEPGGGARLALAGPRDQGLGGGPGISKHAECEALTQFLARARKQRRLRIDADHAAGVRDDWRLGPLQREVEGLAQQHDQVGFLEQRRERAERGVVDAARALHEARRAPAPPSPARRAAAGRAGPKDGVRR